MYNFDVKIFFGKLKIIDNLYFIFVFRNHQIIYSEDVNGTKSSYMDFKNFKKNKLGMVDSNQINQMYES